jgi:O-antigen ligase
LAFILLEGSDISRTNLYNNPMLKKIEQNSLVYIVAIFGSFTSLVIAPGVTYDVVNPPKLIMLTTGAFAGLFTLLKYKVFVKNQLFNKVHIASIYFLLISLLIYFVSSLEKTSQFFGIQGRNTGLLTYISLLLILLTAAHGVNKINLRILLKFFLITSFISTFYGLIQVFNLDPLPWEQVDSWIASFYANPNFFSAFTGIATGILFGLLFKSSIKTFPKILLVCAIAVNIFLLKETLAYQGPAVLLIMIAVILFFNLRNVTKLRKLSYVYLASIGVIVVYVALAILKLVPGGSILNKPSLTARVDFWRTAVAIFTDHPIFGVGFDGYRNFDGRYRDLESTFNINNLDTTDASHNVFLDFAVNGGILLLSAYLIILFLTLLSVVRVIRRNDKVETNFMIIVASWIGYLAQSAISINHLGIAIWGWIFAGAIIGYDVYESQSVSEELPTKGGRQTSVKVSIKSKFPLPAFVGGIVGLLLALPFHQANSDIWQAFKFRDAVALETAAKKWPRDVILMTVAAKNLNDAGNVQGAIKLLNQAHEQSPDTVYPLKLLYNLTPESDPTKALIKSKIDRLDPFYFEILQRSK